jgi:alpha-L-rhamnosidase
MIKWKMYLIAASIIFMTSRVKATEKPVGLLCELMSEPASTLITDVSPDFSWIYVPTKMNDEQSAFRILVASSKDLLDADRGDLWDSGKIESKTSINVVYDGTALMASNTYFWKVRVWNGEDQVSAFSEMQKFITAETLDDYSTPRHALVKRRVTPVRFVDKGDGRYFIDFGLAAFGTIEIKLSPVNKKNSMVVHLGEKIKDESKVDRKPGGSIRYKKIRVKQNPGEKVVVVSIPADERNTREHAIKMPPEIGEVFPFRYVEIEKGPENLTEKDVTMLAVNYPFDDEAAFFQCSNPVLNDVWEFCKYSIKATSFCGVYVDGDRERIPYEADAYINQLGHYCVDREYAMARYSHEYLITNPTWPTEWILHSVLMAWADYLYSGDAASLAHYYDDLKAKTLLALARQDGLISTRTGLVTKEVLSSVHFDGTLKDIVDWPPGSFTKGGIGERDGYAMGKINTVVNAFHFQALDLMGRIATVLDKTSDAEGFYLQAEKVKASINNKLFDAERGIYIDCEDSTHACLHANMFPLAFGLAPSESKQSIVDFIKSRGMACSVYGAQYLLDALYNAGEGEYALELMIADHDRSWPHMIYNVGTTISLEAWDRKYKNNLDWNHAWGAAPANIIPRQLFGVQPLSAGFASFQIKPQPGDLEWGRLKMPTIRGAVAVNFCQFENSFELEVTVPGNSKATIFLPSSEQEESLVLMDGVLTKGNFEDGFICIRNVGAGQHKFVSTIN